MDGKQKKLFDPDIHREPDGTEYKFTGALFMPVSKPEPPKVTAEQAKVYDKPILFMCGSAFVQKVKLSPLSKTAKKIMRKQK